LKCDLGFALMLPLDAVDLYSVRRLANDPHALYSRESRVTPESLSGFLDQIEGSIIRSEFCTGLLDQGT
jgi:hypothetical protein